MKLVDCFDMDRYNPFFKDKSRPDRSMSTLAIDLDFYGFYVGQAVTSFDLTYFIIQY